MRVLLVHQLYQLRGGAARVLFGIEESLSSHGHDVAVFTCSTERDQQRGASSLCAVDGFDSQQFKRSASHNRLRWAAHGIYSIPARLALRRAIADFRPDVACVLKPEYQLSPSVLAELGVQGVPVLQWLVDYRPWCTGGQFYNRELSEVCTRCASGSHFHAAWYRCDQGNRTLSVYGAVARTVNSTVLRLPWSASWYVVPTDATRRFLAETVGLSADRIDVIPHPMDVSRFEPRAGAADGPLLSLGGLDSHKGMSLDNVNLELESSLAQLQEALLDQRKANAALREENAALWTYVDVPGVEPTNNLAERTIRPYVLWRRVSFGTQSERGNRFVERMMTVSATCGQQNRNVHEYMTAAVQARTQGEAIPSLLPQAKAEIADAAA